MEDQGLTRQVLHRQDRDLFLRCLIILTERGGILILCTVLPSRKNPLLLHVVSVLRRLVQAKFWRHRNLVSLSRRYMTSHTRLLV
jgi:hypothetical protein